MAEAGKGDRQRPTDLKQYGDNYDKIKFSTPKGCDGSCGYPFCDCVETCKERKENGTQD